MKTFNYADKDTWPPATEDWRARAPMEIFHETEWVDGQMLFIYDFDGPYWYFCRPDEGQGLRDRIVCAMKNGIVWHMESAPSLVEQGTQYAE